MQASESRPLSLGDVPAQAQETVLHSFAGGSDREEPFAGLTNVNGVLYGTTLTGGPNGDGTVFKITTSSMESVIHAFGGKSDGENPIGDLTNVNGVLYGTTNSGGANGHGTVYEVAPSGALNVLYSFKGGSDGAGPYAGLTYLNGVLYGTTYYGGPSNDGTVFQITTSGTESVLHAFGSGRDGQAVYAGLTDVNGVLYGTTREGGDHGAGTVFKITTSGAESVVYSFEPGARQTSIIPNGLTNVDGVLYGTSRFGGAFSYGSFFKVTTSGAEKSLHSFGGGNDGRYPSEGSLTNVNGVLYGTTDNGGIGPKDGTVFKITTSGEKSPVYQFLGGIDGSNSEFGFTEINGVLYGTTAAGGANNEGTVFSLSV